MSYFTLSYFKSQMQVSKRHEYAKDELKGDAERQSGPWETKYDVKRQRCEGLAIIDARAP